MHKSLSKNDKQNFLENTSKSNEPNLEKLTRKMEQFEKILTQLDEKISVFESKSKKKSQDSLYDRDFGFKGDINLNELSSKLKVLDVKFSDNKELLEEKIEEIDKKLRLFIKRVEEIDKNSNINTLLEKRVAHLEKMIEKLNEKQKEKEVDRLYDPSPYKNQEKIQDEIRETHKTDPFFKSVSDPKKKNSTDYLKNTQNILESREFKELREGKETKIRESNRDIKETNRELRENAKDLRENIKEKPRDFRDINGDLREMNKDFRESNRDVRENQKDSRDNQRINRDPKDKTKELNKDDFDLKEESTKELRIKNESKYSQLFNKINTERPYLLDNAVLKDTKNIRNNLNSEEYAGTNYQRDRYSKPDSHQKTHSFYLNQEEENPRKKNTSSIENIEKQEKRKKIDEEIDKRLNLENERRQKFMGNFENKKKIDEKIEDYNKTEEDKFHFTPMSTEKSRNKEITSRLKLENKLKEDKITKISLNLLNK